MRAWHVQPYMINTSWTVVTTFMRWREQTFIDSLLYHLQCLIYWDQRFLSFSSEVSFISSGIIVVDHVPLHAIMTMQLWWILLKLAVCMYNNNYYVHSGKCNTGPFMIIWMRSTLTILTELIVIHASQAHVHTVCAWSHGQCIAAHTCIHSQSHSNFLLFCE